MTFVLLFSLLIQSTICQFFNSPLLSLFSPHNTLQNGFIGLVSPLKGDSLHIPSIFIHPREEQFESINDYDNQLVHYKKERIGHGSKGITTHHWIPLSHSSLSTTNHKRSERMGEMGTHLVKISRPSLSTSIPSDYEDSVEVTGRRRDKSVFPPVDTPSLDMSLTAPLIKNRHSSIESSPLDVNFNKLESEISSFSSVHQTVNGNYRNVEKILSAFKNLLVDPNKPKKILMLDDSEIGKNGEMVNQLFESDIVLTMSQVEGIVMSEKEKRERRRRQKRKVITGGVYRWTDPSSIPYRWNDHDVEWKSRILDGMRLWENQTCLRFNENYGARDHIVFYKGSGCFSSVGKTGGSQMISIGQGCHTTGIIAHEIAHSLGFWHEQSRPDRDYYIRIRREFVASGSETNFLKSSNEETDSMGLPYDLGSIMHYGPEAFSSRHGETTVETLNIRYESTIGQRRGPSFIDIKQMNRLYCNDVCGGMQLACRHGGYPDPNHCQSCKCPDGLAGPICNHIQGDCGSELVATQDWLELIHHGKGDCVWRIATKKGKIRLRLSTLNFKCKRTCENYVEVKSAVDLQLTGFRTCCDEEWSVVSEGQEVLILVRSHSDRINSMKMEYVRVNSLTELVEDREKERKAPPIRWTKGQENRGFRGIRNGPVEKFTLNSMDALGWSSPPSSLLFSPFALPNRG